MEQFIRTQADGTKVICYDMLDNEAKQAFKENAIAFAKNTTLHEFTAEQIELGFQLTEVDDLSVWHFALGENVLIDESSRRLWVNVVMSVLDPDSFPPVP